MNWQLVWSAAVGSAFGTLGSLLVAWVTSRLSRTAVVEQSAADRARELHEAVVSGEMHPATAQHAIRLLRTPRPRWWPTGRADRLNAPLDARLDALDERTLPPERAEDYPEYDEPIPGSDETHPGKHRA